MGLTCQGEGTVQTESASVSKTTQGESIGTIAEGQTVHVVPDNGLGKSKYLFVYAEFNSTGGGSRKEYVWIKASEVKLNQVEKEKPESKEKSTDEASPKEKETWRSMGNLRGNPPIRSENPHNLNVIEDEATYSDLLANARESLKSLKAKVRGMKVDGEIVDHKY